MSNNESIIDLKNCGSITFLSPLYNSFDDNGLMITLLNNELNILLSEVKFTTMVSIETPSASP